ncbi:MAG: GAF domain-containing protein [Polyangiaceae bacterium]|nr:GAF domain-containing protein [Polyangiaceae bacterium]
MGEQARRFFAEAERLGGIPAKARLAALARTTSAEASAAPDAPELSAKLNEALIRLKEELGPRERGVLTPVPPLERSDDNAAPRLRRHIGTFVDLMSQRALVLGDVDATARRVNEAAAIALNVARVSVWLLDPKKTKISCLDLFEAKSGKHSNGIELFARDFGAYFKALETERTIAASDARTDPRTSCFATSYLVPLGIGAMLDTPIWVRNQMVGVVCHEHVGASRIWDADEERFGYLMSNFIGLALERTRPGATSAPP